MAVVEVALERLCTCSDASLGPLAPVFRRDDRLWRCLRCGVEFREAGIGADRRRIVAMLHQPQHREPWLEVRHGLGPDVIVTVRTPEGNPVLPRFQKTQPGRVLLALGPGVFEVAIWSVEGREVRQVLSWLRSPS